MDYRFLEIRDSGTFIPALALKMKSSIPEGEYLLGRSGFSHHDDNHFCIMLIKLATEECRYDAYHWGGSRTMSIAHKFIQEHFDSLAHGDIVDVQFILGETSEKKLSERFTT